MKAGFGRRGRVTIQNSHKMLFSLVSGRPRPAFAEWGKGPDLCEDFVAEAAAAAKAQANQYKSLVVLATCPTSTISLIWSLDLLIVDLPTFSRLRCGQISLGLITISIHRD